jgi:hypothetical protein
MSAGKSDEGYSEYETEDDPEGKGKKGTNLDRMYLKKVKFDSKMNPTCERICGPNNTQLHSKILGGR